MSYMVSPSVNLIAQDQSMACWFASLRMLTNWRSRKDNSAYPDPATVPGILPEYFRNNGLQWEIYTRIARYMGLDTVSLRGNISTGVLEDMLYMSGPLWLDGLPINFYNSQTDTGGHVVVLAGVQGEEIVIYDPLPVNRGCVWNISLSVLNAFLGDRANPNRPVNIMCFPARRISGRV